MFQSNKWNELSYPGVIIAFLLFLKVASDIEKLRLNMIHWKTPIYNTCLIDVTKNMVWQHKCVDSSLNNLFELFLNQTHTNIFFWKPIKANLVVYPA